MWRACAITPNQQQRRVPPQPATAASFLFEFTQQFLTQRISLFRRSHSRNIPAGKQVGSGVTSSAKMMTIDSIKVP
jgi:hypothetical protein